MANGNQETAVEPETPKPEAEDSPGVEPPGTESDRSSDEAGGYSESRGDTENGRDRDSGTSAQEARDHLRRRHPTGVRPEEVEALTEDLTQAFQEGDPKKAWDLANRLGQVSKDLAIEAGKLRFKVNFGTPMCRNCDGLKAGPGVVATCFQVQQCHFTNFKEGDTSPRQKRVLDSLLAGVNRS